METFECINVLQANEHLAQGAQLVTSAIRKASPWATPPVRNI